MDLPSFKEDYISQIPALQMLLKLGYNSLSPADAERQRSGKPSNVLLEDILRRQLKEINSIQLSATPPAYSQTKTYLSELRMRERIENTGTYSQPKWSLKK